MRWERLLGLSLLLTTGCGAFVSAPSNTTGADQEASIQSELAVDATTVNLSGSAVDPVQINPIRPVFADHDAGSDTSPAEGGISPFDAPLEQPESAGSESWGGLLEGGDYENELLSLYLDLVAIDLLTPTTPAELNAVSNLELLCRDTDIPDFVCRQRFGQ